MNLVSDLSSEIAMAILVKKEYSKEIGSKDAVNLIGKVQEILQSISNGEKPRSAFLKNDESKIIIY